MAHSSAASCEESTGRIALPATLTAVASQKGVCVVVSKRSVNIALYVCMQVTLGSTLQHMYMQVVASTLLTNVPEGVA